MPSRYPKFESKINDLHTSKQNQTVTSSYGIVMSYDPITNTATVVVSLKGAESSGKAYRNVSCPVSVGVQSVGPVQGQPCWLDFKDDKDVDPVIVSFFNPRYDTINAPTNNAAPMKTPLFTFKV